MEKIYIHDAIREMRELTKDDQSFSITFCTYSVSRKKSNGITKIDRATVRKAHKGQSDDILGLFCNDTRQAKQCYISLILFFNNKAVYVNRNE